MGVKAYPDLQGGAQATDQTLTNGYYPDIVANLQSSTPYWQWGTTSTAQVRTWGTNGFANQIAAGNQIAPPATYPPDWLGWAYATLAGIGAPGNDTNLQSLWTWTIFEKPAGQPTQWNNPLNTTQDFPGAVDVQAGGGVAAAPSAASGGGGGGRNTISLLGSNIDLTGALGLVQISIGVMLIGGGVLILAISVIGGPSRAMELIPQGRALRAVSSGSAQRAPKTATSTSQEPTPPRLSESTEGEVAAARRGEGRRLSPGARAELTAAGRQRRRSA